MRCIGTLADEKQLDTFVAFLLTKGIPAHVERDSQEPKIWIRNEDDVGAAQQLLARFASNPHDAEFTHAVEQANEILRVEAKKRSDARKLVQSFSPPTRLGPTYRAPLTVALTTLCVVLWFFQTFTTTSGPARREDSTIHMLRTPLFKALTFTAIPPEHLIQFENRSEDDIQVRLYNVMRGEIWRLVTPIFIHFGVAHLVFNLLALYQLGRVLEHRYGTLFLAVSVVAIAVISNSLQAATPSSIGGSPIAVLDRWGLSLFGGISGVVFGLLGIAWMKSRFDWSAGFFVPRSTIIWAIAWFALGLSPWDKELLGANMANWAHGAGLVAGVIIGYLTAIGSSPRTPKSS